MLEFIARRYRSFRGHPPRKYPGVNFLGDYEIIGRPPLFGGHGLIEIGAGVRLRNAPSLYADTGGHIVIGARTLLNNAVSIFSCQRVEIGADCLIADQVGIFDSQFHQIDEGSTPVRAPIKIGRNVWIGYRAIILAGVEIGDHSVIGAGSIVTKPVPSRVVAAGNPARVLRELRASDDFRRI
ncbi:MAG: acyltransferase [Rhizomicrobium sp.]